MECNYVLECDWPGHSWPIGHYFEAYLYKIRCVVQARLVPFGAATVHATLECSRTGRHLDFNPIVHWFLITKALVGGGHVHATVVAGFNPNLVPGGRHSQRGLRAWLPHLFRRGDFLVCLSFVNFQSTFSFEGGFTLVTQKGIIQLLVGFQTSGNSSFRWRLLVEELLSAPGISSHGWWAAPLLDLGDRDILALPGVQGEGEVGADGDRELEYCALKCQCLAEIQALGHQGGVGLAHSSSLLNFLNLTWSQKVRHVTATVQSVEIVSL